MNSTGPRSRKTRSPDGVRWDVMAADIRWFFRRLPGAIGSDPTAILLIAANVYPVVKMAVLGEPVASILVVHWFQMLVIGFWYSVRLAALTHWKALLLIPIFLLMYLSIVNIFGIMVGAMLDDSLRGTAWHDDFSLWNYATPAAVFFITHGISFYLNFIRGREIETTTWEEQMGTPILRAMPMWLATLAGAFVGALFGPWAVAVLCVLPVKISLDVLGHLYSHGKLDFEDHPPEPA